MSIWRTTPVDQDPEVSLVRWSIYEVDKEGGDRHFVGWNLDGEGRVSSAIQTFDAATRRGVTRSGRVYQLIDEPGFHPDAAYVWERWKGINKITFENDITEQIFEEMK